MIPLAEWARKCGKDPELARQKKARGSLDVVVIGKTTMIEDSTPWEDLRRKEYRDNKEKTCKKDDVP